MDLVQAWFTYCPLAVHILSANLKSKSPSRLRRQSLGIQISFKYPMKILQVYLISPIWWRISNDDPKSLALDTLNGVKLINPLLYPEISKLIAGEDRDEKVFITDNEYYLKSNILLLGSENLFVKHDPEIFVQLSCLVISTTFGFAPNKYPFKIEIYHL